MTKLRRRKALELGAAAAIIGPSVVFSRSAGAAEKGSALALREKNFKVEIEYFEDLTDNKIRQANVRGVVVVDLGSVKITNKASPQFEPVSVTLAPKHGAGALTRTFKKALVGGHKQKPGATNMKISVSLYGDGGRRPALTYHVLDAVPQSLSQNKLEQHELKWSVGKIEKVTHKVGGATGRLASLPHNYLKVEAAGATVGAAKRVTRYSWSADKGLRRAELAPDQNLHKTWSSPKMLKVELGANKSTTRVSKVESFTAEHKHSDRHLNKIDVPALKHNDQVAISMFVTAGRDLKSADDPKPAASFDGWPAKWELGDIDVHGQGPKNHLAVKVELRSVQFPRLEAGSKALVTETHHFDLRSGGR